MTEIRQVVDVVALALDKGCIHVLLIKRKNPAFAGRWALPGGHVNPGEGLKRAAIRELQEETGIHCSNTSEVIQVGTFGNPKRDPRGHIIDTAFLALFQERVDVTAADDATEALWFPLGALPEEGLAFDHLFIIRLALTKMKIEHQDLELDQTLWLAFCPLAVEQDGILYDAGRFHPNGEIWNENDPDPKDEDEP